MDNASRTKKTKTNIVVSILYQLIYTVIGLVLPRFILRTFGSDVNGIMRSIDQLLSCTMLLEGGIGGMVLASFYLPLASNDSRAVSDIFNNTKRFFNRISAVYAALVILFSVFATLIINTEYDPTFVGALVLILGLTYYFNYYLGVTHQLLLKADQKLYIVQLVLMVTLTLNAGISIGLMESGAGIHVVKLVSAFVFLLNPLIYRIYIKQHYDISKKLFDPNRRMPRKRDGVIHHVAYFIHRNTDVVILSIFRGVKEVSVYSIYYSVVVGLENFLTAVSNGLAGVIGNIIAKKENKLLTNSFEVYEMCNTFLTSFFCTAAAVLILPFVRIYTDGVTDAEYIRPSFAYLLIAAQWFYCIRIPYNNVINSAGHYGQTKPGAYMEAALNFFISLLTVHKFGLAGVAFGTMTAMLARTVYMAWYLSKNILKRNFRVFIRNSGIHIAVSVIIVFVMYQCYEVPSDSFMNWGINAAFVSIITIVCFAALSFILNRKTYISLFKEIKIRRNHHGRNEF